MFAIVDIQGQQFKVEQGQEVFVHRLDAKEGDNLTFDQVKLITQDDKTSVGTPLLGKTTIGVTVLEHVKGDKVLVFKKKRRKGYQKLNGHRQALTKIKIDSINA